MNAKLETLIDLLTFRYPPFVYGREMTSGEIPIFIFHDVKPDYFRNIVEFLARNGYSTITATEALMLHEQGRLSELPARTVMLTFDDGKKTVWTVAYPLLKKHGFKATTFLIPSRVADNVGLGELLNEDNEKQINTSFDEYMNWDEIRAIHQSGVMDFHSHTFNHRWIYTSDRVIDFVSPVFQKQYRVHQLPGCAGEGVSPLGRPVYQYAPRLQARPAFVENGDLRIACERYVADNGGEGFFKQEGWRKELHSFFNTQRSKLNGDIQYETEEQVQEAIWKELHDSKKEIEKNIPGVCVDQLCLPWGGGSEMTTALAKKAGYRAIHWGKVNGRYMFGDLDDPIFIARMGEDFFPLLPGNGRRGIGQLLKQKIRKNLPF